MSVSERFRVPSFALHPPRLGMAATAVRILGAIWPHAVAWWLGSSRPLWQHAKVVSDQTSRLFGLGIAYVVPGFVVLLGMSHANPDLARWLRGVGESGPGVGGVLYAMVASIGLGMTASLLRWLVLDHIFEWCGVKRPATNEALLADRLEAVDYEVDHHYRYYQFYGNGLLAGLGAYAFARTAYAPSLLVDFGLLLLAAAFVAGARDALVRYFAALGQLLPPAANLETLMTNGKHPHGSSSSKPDTAAPKPGDGTQSHKPVQKLVDTSGQRPHQTKPPTKPA